MGGKPALGGSSGRRTPYFPVQSGLCCARYYRKMTVYGCFAAPFSISASPSAKRAGIFGRH